MSYTLGLIEAKSIRRGAMFKTNLKFFIMKHKRKILITAISIPTLIIAAWILIPMVVPVFQDWQEARRFANLDRQDFIEDFDFLVEMLRENFPFEDAIYYRRGLNIWELADHTRALLVDPSTPMDTPNDFFDLMREEFFAPIHGMGHLLILDYSRYRQQINNFLFGLQVDEWRRHRGLGLRTEFPVTDLWRDTLFAPPVTSFYDSIIGEMLEGDWGDGVGSMMDFEVLEPNSILYIEINRLAASFEQHYINQMQSWLEYAVDFEHLIIDIRNLSGGHAYAWHWLASWLVDRAIDVSFYVHYNLGTNNEAWAAAYVFENRRLASYPYEGYGFDRRLSQTFSIWPPHTWYPTHHRPHGYDRPRFSGQVWVLVDGDTSSSAELFAAIIKYSDFATLVGERTFGADFSQALAQTWASFYLPNSGIVILYNYGVVSDSQGNFFVGSGVEPYYPNRPSMDALETVLVIINEAREVQLISY